MNYRDTRFIQNESISQEHVGIDGIRSGFTGMSLEVFMGKVMPIFAMGILIAAIGGLTGMFIITRTLFFTAVIAEFILLFALKANRRRRPLNVILLYLFTFCSGLTLAPILIFANVMRGNIIIFQAFLITAGVFFSLIGYAMVTKKNFSKLGGFLFMALMGLIVSSLIFMFFPGPILFFAINIGSVIIFSLFVLYDMSNIMRRFTNADAVDAACDLYLDFVNLFIAILRILIAITSSRD